MVNNYQNQIRDQSIRGERNRREKRQPERCLNEIDYGRCGGIRMVDESILDKNPAASHMNRGENVHGDESNEKPQIFLLAGSFEYWSANRNVSHGSR
jgi:hypothetical protein